MCHGDIPYILTHYGAGKTIVFDYYNNNVVGPEPANHHFLGSLSCQWSPPGVAYTDISAIMHQSSILVRSAKADEEALIVSTAQYLIESGTPLWSLFVQTHIHVHGCWSHLH